MTAALDICLSDAFLFRNSSGARRVDAYSRHVLCIGVYGCVEHERFTTHNGERGDGDPTDLLAISDNNVARQTTGTDAARDRGPFGKKNIALRKVGYLDVPLKGPIHRCCRSRESNRTSFDTTKLVISRQSPLTTASDKCSVRVLMCCAVRS